MLRRIGVWRRTSEDMAWLYGHRYSIDTELLRLSKLRFPISSLKWLTYLEAQYHRSSSLPFDLTALDELLEKIVHADYLQRHIVFIRTMSSGQYCYLVRFPRVGAPSHQQQRPTSSIMFKPPSNNATRCNYVVLSTAASATSPWSFGSLPSVSCTF